MICFSIDAETWVSCQLVALGSSSVYRTFVSYRDFSLQCTVSSQVCSDEKVITPLGLEKLLNLGRSLGDSTGFKDF